MVVVLPTPSDGNCLFSALASFFNDPRRIDHALVRRMIVHYIYQHPEHFEQDIAAEGYKDVEAYCEAMSRSGYWGDGIACQCFALMFRVNVWVFYGADAAQGTQMTHYEGRPNVVLRLNGEHYERIISW